MIHLNSTLIYSLKNFLGIDKDISWILISRIATIIKGPITVAFIIIFLDVNQQGLWYSFISLAAISILAELGFTLIITQFVSHEYAHLRLYKGFIAGRSKNSERLFSLIRYAFKFYIVVTPIAFILMTIWGYYILSPESGDYLYAWYCFAFISVIQLFVSLMQSIYQGLDKVAIIYRHKTIGTISLALVTLPLLFMGFEIWSLVLSSLFSLIIMLVLLLLDGNKFWMQLLRFKIKKHYDWFQEIVALQGKYAVSWFSGYLAFHLLVPFTYKYHGAEIAGQLGLTISLLNNIKTLSSAWLESKIPKFNIMVSRGLKHEVSSLFNKSAIQGYIFFIFGVTILLLLIYISNYYQLYNDRVLSLYLVFLLVLSNSAGIIVLFMAKFLRAHKAEPYYLLSLFNGVLVAGSIYFILPISFSNTIASLVFIYWFAILPVAYWIYLRFKANHAY